MFSYPIALLALSVSLSLCLSLFRCSSFLRFSLSLNPPPLSLCIQPHWDRWEGSPRETDLSTGQRITIYCVTTSEVVLPVSRTASCDTCQYQAWCSLSMLCQLRSAHRVLLRNARNCPSFLCYPSTRALPCKESSPDLSSPPPPATRLHTHTLRRPCCILTLTLTRSSRSPCAVQDTPRLCACGACCAFSS